MSARETAYEILSRWFENPGSVARLDEQLARAALPAHERPFAVELVYGVVRRRATLDAIVAPFLRRPLEKVEAGLHGLLALGAYQLVLLSGAPPYAVVNETAELARKVGMPRWTGFVNGVLRAIARAMGDDWATAPAADAVPLADGRYRRIGQRVFPDPTLDFAGYFAQAFSFPPWLVERWRQRFEPSELAALGFWFNGSPRLSLRINTLKVSRDDYLAALAAAGIAASPGKHPDAVRLEQAAHVPDLPGFNDGWFVVQDESAMGAATLLAPRPGERVLDLCAAPGGKSTHLAMLMHNEGSVVAADVDRARLALVDENCRRLGLSIVAPQLVRRDLRDLPVGLFDRVLLDVPCSNTGVLGKRPEARWRLSPGDVDELADLQSRLFDAALARLAAGGRMVYSTCSIEPEENRELIASKLGSHRELSLSSEQPHWPGRPADGGYQALLVKAQD